MSILFSLINYASPKEGFFPTHHRIKLRQRPKRVGDPATDAYFGFYLLAMGSGRARTKAEIDGLLRAAGFGVSRVHKTPIPLICSVISTNPV